MKILISFLTVISVTFAANGQTTGNLPGVDPIFKMYNQKTPGCALAIVRNDSLIYAKGYGMASLEHGVPIGPETTFQIGSDSKQFTAFCILRLVRDGKLSLSEDIRQYLSWLPNYHAKITIYELLHHTSGIRETTLYGPGMIIEAHGQLKKAIMRQTTLNFEPGTRQSYCSTGYHLLGEIIKSVTGKSLRQYADSVIFHPLHMEHTFYNDIQNEVIPNLAEGYMPKGNGIYTCNDEPGGESAGGSGIVSTVNDMAKWLIYLCNPPKADEALIAQLFQKGKLNDGTEFNYGAGIGMQIINGRQAYDHSGKVSGYNAFLAVFPKERTGFIFLSNAFDYSANDTAVPVMNLLLPGEMGPPTLTKNDTLALKIKDTRPVQPFVGDYLSTIGQPLSISLNDNLLFVDIYGQHALMEPKGNGVYQIPAFGGIQVNLAGEGNGRHIIFDITNDYQPKANTPVPKAEEEMAAYTGHYYCCENDFAFDIVLRNHKLVLTSSRYDDSDLNFVNADEVYNNNWWMYHLTMLRDSQGKITGFEVNVTSIYHLRYDKLN